MVHCLLKYPVDNHHKPNQKEEEDYLDIVNEEMMLLTTKDKHEHNLTKNEHEIKGEAFSILSYDQVKRLHLVMEQVVPINGRGNFPTLDIKLKDLVKVVRTKLENEQSVKVNDIRLNGGAASYVLLPENSNYNDLDLIFTVNLSDALTYDKIRTAVLDSLFDFLPEGVSRTRISLNSLKEAYIHKMVKVSEKDQWSLISLSNNQGRNVELKFVDRMKRQFEFSVDSFHIILNSLNLFYECSEMPISENIYPTVIAESVYGNFNEAFSHLEKKLIATRQPEQIRGGGLLKYCNLLIRNYKPAQPEEIKNLERYMCSRFFIDFSELPQQRAKLESYLANHFIGDDLTKTQYLMQLYKVVDESTVCLMSHERRQTLALIGEMAYHFYLKSQQRQQPHYPQLHVQTSHFNKSQQYYLHFHSHHHHHNHHQMLRHPHYDMIIATQKLQNHHTSNNNNTNNNSNSSNNTSNNKNRNSNLNQQQQSLQQSHHHHHHQHHSHHSNCKNNAKNQNNNNANCNNSTSNQQQQQQHMQQQYHAYLFGTNGNTFYFNPYHHHNYPIQQHGCFNSCHCGGWMACA